MTFEDPQSQLNRRGTDPMIEVLSHDVRRMREDMADMKSGVIKMTEALNKLVVVEERQSAQGQAIERAFTEIAKMQNRVDEDSDKHTTRVETAIANVNSSVQRLHSRIDDHAKTQQDNLKDIERRLDEVEQMMPETNRMKEWFFEAVKWLALAGVMYYAAKAGVQL